MGCLADQVGRGVIIAAEPEDHVGQEGDRTADRRYSASLGFEAVCSRAISSAARRLTYFRR